MLRDITIGQYYQGNSLVHRMDPRTKILCTLLYLISLFLFRSIAGFVLVSAFLAVMIALTKVPLRFMLKGLKAIFILLLITVFFNLFFTQGTVIVKLWIFKLTYEGIQNAIFLSIRLIYLILGASVLTLTTTPNALTDGLESLLHPLAKIHVPVHEVAMMMSIALRFIPILMEETDKIMKAQMARGADLDSGNLAAKAKAMIPILVPLFVSAFRRASDLALAMEARCYHGGNNRTKMKPLHFHKRDVVTLIIAVVYFALIIVVFNLKLSFGIFVTF